MWEKLADEPTFALWGQVHNRRFAGDPAFTLDDIKKGRDWLNLSNVCVQIVR